ncbi:unnamed protein product [Phytophthora lilii]|uniref:Unnamed protein product n=1 Tax=Phytophthora lilii TaxID=2077276 RepID=A0A9W6YL57_9STRA|nr:unnamed protein product [Phytophthora lilii]
MRLWQRQSRQLLGSQNSRVIDNMDGSLSAEGTGTPLEDCEAIRARIAIDASTVHASREAEVTEASVAGSITSQETDQFDSGIRIDNDEARQASCGCVATLKSQFIQLKTVILRELRSLHKKERKRRKRERRVDARFNQRYYQQLQKCMLAQSA